MALSNQQFIISIVLNQDVRSFQHVSRLKTSTKTQHFFSDSRPERLRMTCASASACWTALSPWNRWWLTGFILGFVHGLPEMEDFQWDFPYRTVGLLASQWTLPHFLEKWTKHHSPLQSGSFYSWYYPSELVKMLPKLQNISGRHCSLLSKTPSNPIPKKRWPLCDWLTNDRFSSHQQFDWNYGTVPRTQETPYTWKISWVFGENFRLNPERERERQRERESHSGHSVA